MKRILTLEDALKKIEELEKENAKLKDELEYYKNKKRVGVKSIMLSGWLSIMISLFVMKVAWLW